MEPLLAAWEQVCDRFQALQAAHKHYLENTVHPDLAKLAFERAQAFAELKNRLITVVQTLSRSGTLAQHSPALCARLRVLQDSDVALRARIDTYRRALETQLARLRQGRTALQGYRGAKAPSRPRFVNRSA